MYAVFLTLWSAADVVRWDIDLAGVLICVNRRRFCEVGCRLGWGTDMCEPAADVVYWWEGTK